MTFLNGLLAGLLAQSLVGIVAAIVAGRRGIRRAMARETAALDAMHAAELRSVKQIDAMLDRISTAPRLDLSESKLPTAPTSDRKYIADHAGDDAAWNEFRGEPEEDE